VAELKRLDRRGRQGARDLNATEAQDRATSSRNSGRDQIGTVGDIVVIRRSSTMKAKLKSMPSLRSDEEAEQFVAKADLSNTTCPASSLCVSRLLP
jgi:hypothetical protein